MESGNKLLVHRSTVSEPRMLLVEEGQDYFLEDGDHLPYTLLENIGHGHSATVEKVQDMRTGSVYARKVFRIYNTRDRRREIFENEIKIIRRLARHHHIIRVFATYVAKGEVGLLLSPVADRGDLEAFLQDYNEKSPPIAQERRILESSFGCLASGLTFMHSQRIRHKDIKPRNILIHQGSVIYTDFGYSLDHSAASGSTTTGRPDSLTRRYCAPEVKDHDPRNSKSDIFSLGCVFIEILAALERLPDPRSATSAYHEIIPALHIILGKLVHTNPVCSVKAEITHKMLESQPSRRPRAKDIIDGLWAGEAEGFCKPCRVMLSPPSLSPSNAEENQTTGFRPSGRRPKPTERLDNECSTSPDDQPSVCRKRKHSHLNPSPCLHGTPEAISSPFNGMPIFSAGKGCPRNPYHRVADGLDAFDDSNFDPGTSSMAPSPTRSRSRSSVGGASSKEPMLDITNRLEPIRNGPGAVPSASGVTQSLFPHDHRHPDPITPANPIHAQSRPSVPEEHRFILLGRHDAFQQPLCGPGYVSTRELRKLTRDIEERRRRRRAMAKVETPSMGQYSSRSEGTFADRTLNLKQAVSDAILN